MTYLQFLLIFLIVPLIILYRLYKKSELPNKKEFRFAIMILIFLAVTYTTPWDNYLVKTGVWMYGNGRILGTIGYVPIEEYCFFVFQTILSGLICFLLQKRFPLKKEKNENTNKNIVSVIYIIFFLVGVTSLRFEKTRYLGLVLTWAMPVILLQWLVGGRYLLANRKIFLATLLIPTVYLCVADGLAISKEIWTISEVYTIGFNAGSLPLEEALFFLVTNLMVSQATILFVVMDEEIINVLNMKTKVLKKIRHFYNIT